MLTGARFRSNDDETRSVPGGDGFVAVPSKVLVVETDELRPSVQPVLPGRQRGGGEGVESEAGPRRDAAPRGR